MLMIYNDDWKLELKKIEGNDYSTNCFKSFLIMEVASKPLMDFPLEDWYRLIKVCKISFWTDVNMSNPHNIN